MERQSANIEICDKLKEFFSKEENKDLRFFQGLTATKLVKHVPVSNALGVMLYSLVEDNFNEESLITLNNLIDNTPIEHEKTAL